MINVALRLPAPDIDALLQGRTIAAIVNQFIIANRKFALCPTDESNLLLPVEQYYRSNFLTVAKNSFTQFNNSGVLIQPQQTILFTNNEQLQLPLIDHQITLLKAWAKCEQCQNITDAKSLNILSQLTIWTQEALQEILNKRPNIFLAYLRVYKLSTSIEITVKSNNLFVPLPEPVNVSDSEPVLSDIIFTQRKKQLETLEPPLHPELEELHDALLRISEINPAAQQLESDIKIFLGWSSERQINSNDVDLSWIKDIATLGDRSIEAEERKSNYQAGTDFENVTRQSLDFLGFKVEEAYKGGAGGLDLYCSQPYPLVVECKAGRLIPSRTVEELIKLGGMHLGQNNFLNSTKLVIGPGVPSSDTQKAAKEWKVSIINAMTLQKLVELKAKYPGAINLIELQQYLQSGQIDDKIDEYITKLETELKLRSHIIQIIKNYLQNSEYERAGVEALHAIYITSNPSQKLTSKELYEILIELASPLTGYLGRVKGNDWRSDRFYYLRDLE